MPPFYGSILCTAGTRSKTLSDCENVADELAFLKAVVAGLADVEAGRTVSLQQVKKQFGLA